MFWLNCFDSAVWVYYLLLPFVDLVTSYFLPVGVGTLSSLICRATANTNKITLTNFMVLICSFLSAECELTLPTITCIVTKTQTELDAFWLHDSFHQCVSSLPCWNWFWCPFVHTNFNLAECFCWSNRPGKTVDHTTTSVHVHNAGPKGSPAGTCKAHHYVLAFVSRLFSHSMHHAFWLAHVCSFAGRRRQLG